MMYRNSKLSRRAAAARAQKRAEFRRAVITGLWVGNVILASYVASMAIHALTF